MGKFEGEMRARIEKELSRVNQRISALKTEPRAAELDTFGDNTPLSEEIEAAQVGEERELRSDVLGKLLERAAALDESLHRIREGDYGLCVSCGGRIERKRLKAVPEAVYCLRCMAEREGAPTQSPRPTEWKEAEKVYEERDRREREPGKPEPER
jgi:RNA polymerase-binding transcription factor DksA